MISSRDWADKSAYAPTHTRRENALAILVAVFLIVATALDWA